MAEPASRSRILIVDDEESMRLLIASHLRKDLDADLTLAGTSVEALRLLETALFDVIVLDLMMPGLDGFGLLKQIRAATPNRATPVIVVSLLADDRSEARARALGANAFHAKPVRRAELVATVKAQLAARNPSQ